MTPSLAADRAVFDEYDDDGAPRHPALAASLGRISLQELAGRQHQAEQALREKGITFVVYGHHDGAEKIWPFDVVPRPWRRRRSGKLPRHWS